jgi:hypothetical protein
MKNLPRQLVRADDAEGAFADKLVYFANARHADLGRILDAQHRQAEQFAIGAVGPRVLAAYRSALQSRTA